MELLKPYKKYYLGASSLIESVIAICIIAVCLLIALKLYGAIMVGKLPANYKESRFKVENLASDMKLNLNFEQQTYDFKTYKIKKVVSNYKNLTNVKRVSYIVQNATDTTAYHYLFLKNEEL